MPGLSLGHLGAKGAPRVYAANFWPPLHAANSSAPPPKVYSYFDEPELLDDLKDHWVGGHMRGRGAHPSPGGVDLLRAHVLRLLSHVFRPHGCDARQSSHAHCAARLKTCIRLSLPCFFRLQS